MYVVKFQQLFPEGDPLPCKFPTGGPALFQARDDAEKYALELSAQPRHRGYRFFVDAQATANPEDIEAAEAQSFLV